jgi:Flp pilus assembly protein TadD
MRVALFQFATNAMGRAPAVFEHLFYVCLANALQRAAGLEVEDLTPPPREGEILSLAQVLPEGETRKAAERVGADCSLWGGFTFRPEGEPLISSVKVTTLASSRGEGCPVVSRHFSFDGLECDVRSSRLRVDMAALGDLMEDLVQGLAEVVGPEKLEIDPGRIGEGLSFSDRAMVYFVYALRIATEREAKLRLYLKAVSADPYFSAAYVNAAQLLLGERRYGEAAKLLLRAEGNLRGSEAEPDILNLLGVATLHMGMWENAVKVWRRALDRKPLNPEVLCNLAAAHAMREMDVEAESLYREALEADENYPLAWFSLGRFLARKGRFAEAVEAVRRYIRLCPGDPWAYEILGACLSSIGKRDEAEFNLAKAVQLDPDGEAGAAARLELKKLRGED